MRDVDSVSETAAQGRGEGKSRGGRKRGERKVVRRWNRDAKEDGAAGML